MEDNEKWWWVISALTFSVSKFSHCGVHAARVIALGCRVERAEQEAVYSAGHSRPHEPQEKKRNPVRGYGSEGPEFGFLVSKIIYSVMVWMETS